MAEGLRRMRQRKKAVEALQSGHDEQHATIENGKIPLYSKYEKDLKSRIKNRIMG